MKSILAIIVSALLVGSAAAQDGNFGQREVQAACDRAMKFLLSQQWASGCIQELDGKPRFFKQNDTPKEGVAMSALAIMGMASVGHLPSDPTEEGRAMRMALEFVLREEHQREDGYYGKQDNSRMYGHGIITLMLAEMLGMGLDEDMDRKVRESCQNAINLIVQSQKRRSGKNDGGWRYEPDQNDADLSATVWQLMSLRAAKNAGIEVPAETIAKALGYVRRTFDPQKGGFRYEAEGGHFLFSTVAEGLLSMQVCGAYDAEEVIKSSDYLLKEKLEKHNQWFYYGTYYYAQGMAQRGGEYASTAKRATAEALLKTQDKDGFWKADGGNEGSAGRVYATSLALLSLSIHHNFLPIYQR
jgi:hypothetical protein